MLHNFIIFYNKIILITLFCKLTCNLRLIIMYRTTINSPKGRYSIENDYLEIWNLIFHCYLLFLIKFVYSPCYCVSPCSVIRKWNILTVSSIWLNLFESSSYHSLWQYLTVASVALLNSFIFNLFKGEDPLNAGAK